MFVSPAYNIIFTFSKVRAVLLQWYTSSHTSHYHSVKLTKLHFGVPYHLKYSQPFI